MVEPTKNKTEGEMMHTYQRLIEKFQTKPIFPKKHVLDNIASAKYKEAIKKNGMEYELVPPHTHLWKLAERVIQTSEYTFVGILSGLPSSFPWSLWDELLPQVEMNGNILRKLNVAPTISA